MNTPTNSEALPLTTCSACAECGMQVRTGEYHPYAACLMFKGCGKAHTVRENLDYVREDSELMDYLATSWNSQGRGHHIMGRWFPNVSGSLRDAIRCRIDSQPNAERIHGGAGLTNQPETLTPLDDASC